jgi:UDP-N-acetylglucosamine 1-carboxyvinyltransferase
LQAQRIVLEYPSVGATENILMLATKTPGITKIINAALEPEVFDLIAVLKKMGAKIEIQAPATIVIEGVATLQPIEHEIMYDRLEAGSLLIAAAATKGEIYIPQLTVDHMDVFLYKLEEMGHSVVVDECGKGVHFKATENPRAVSFKTSPFPGFPTDLQAPMMALQTKSTGRSDIEETVFEKRFAHIAHLQKMGAMIETYYNKAMVTGVRLLQGAYVVASDIRAAMSLVVAGLMAEGTTIITGIHHWKRGYDNLEHKLAQLGAKIALHDADEYLIKLSLNEKDVQGINQKTLLH